MNSYKLHVYSKPKIGCESEYLKWYKDCHLKEMVSLKGFSMVQQYRPLRVQGCAEQDHFVSVFSVQAEKPEDIMQLLGAASAEMAISTALDTSSVRMEIYEPTTDEISA